MSDSREKTCYLCGNPIVRKPQDPEEAQTKDHVPPALFYPEKVRQSQNLNLWTFPAHKRCNGDYKLDEEYFYHAMYPMVQETNRRMGAVIHQDLMRRTRKPQTPAMARRLLKEFRSVTEGGIHLPPGKYEFSIEEVRIQRIAIKIAQGLYYHENKGYISAAKCKDIRLCLDPSEVPDLYVFAFADIVEEKAVCPDVFSYKYFDLDVEELHLFTMLFWESFIYCIAFESSDKNAK